MNIGYAGAWLLAFSVSCGKGRSDTAPPHVDGIADAALDAAAADVAAADASRLSPDAVRELESLGYRDYDGRAVVTEEVAASLGRPAHVTFDPASGPRCMRGDPYSAFYEDRKSEDLIILLDAGGACWSGFCSANEQVLPYVTEWARLMAFPEAPIEGNFSSATSGETHFGDWNAVSVPYCDGSVFMGDNDFEQPDGSIRYHRGRRNLAAALDLAVEHFPNVERILLVGWSAGGYGTLTAALSVRLRYPGVELYVLNDSGPGLFNPAQTTDMDQRLDEWGYGNAVPPSCTECAQGRGHISHLASWMLERDEAVWMGLATFARDPTIAINLRLPVVEFEPVLRSELEAVHVAHPDRFKRYVVDGYGHVVSSAWDTRTADGVGIDAWTTAMTQRDESVWTDIANGCPHACCAAERAECEAMAGCESALARSADDASEIYLGCVPSTGCESESPCAESRIDGRCLRLLSGCAMGDWGPASCMQPGCPEEPAPTTN